MIIVKLQGGLGNQMFQYAFARILAQKNNTKVVIDGSFFARVANIPGFTPRTFELAIFDNHYSMARDSDLISFLHLSKINKVKKKLRLNYPKVYKEPSFSFQSDALTTKSPVYLKGYFQSYKYLEGYEDFIKQLFCFPINKFDSFNKELVAKFKNQNTIALHIRRGDYVEDKLTQQYHGNCSSNYYLKAIKLLDSKSKDFTLVFFSDDIDWVKKQFEDLPYSKIFVDHNTEENSWKDMLLMSCCSHNVIANSSFSWWAAWLNTNTEKIVVAPKNWFATTENDTRYIIPSEWIQL